MKQWIGKILLILFFAGMAAGILTAFFLRGYFLDEFDLMQAGLLQSLEKQQYSRAELFWYLFWQRTKQMGFFFLLLMTSAGIYVFYLMVVSTGIIGGCYFFASCCRYGISGSIVFLAGFFPQGIFYLILLYLLIKQGPGGSIPQTGHDLAGNGRKKMHHGKKIFNSGGFLKGLLGIILLFLGCFVETCLNPPLLRWILHLTGGG